MVVQDRRETTLLNRIDIQKIDSFDDFRRAGDIIKWIDLQLKKGKFLKTRGREVLVNVAGGKSLKIVNIPGKEEYIDYIKAWLNVYNLSLDYLEGSLNAACLENMFIKRQGNDWTIPVYENGKTERRIIQWPSFSVDNANYAKILDNILDRYNILKQKYIESVKVKELGVSIKKSSVVLNPVNQTSISEVKLNNATFQNRNLNSGYSNLDTESKQSVNDRQNISNYSVNPKLKEAIKNELMVEDTKNAIESDKLVIQKISDGETLDERDVKILQNDNTDIVVVTCQNINNSKEEDIFLSNAVKCQKEKFNVGAFIYGTANDDHMGAIELKRILKSLGKFGNNFSGLVIYSIDNGYVQKNNNSDIKLLDYMNVYNSIANTLKQAGYIVMLSMNLKSAKIIDDINRRYNIQDEHEVIYMAVVRDSLEVNEKASSIIVDPGNDYDVVTIKNKEILNQIKDNINVKGLTKV